MKFSVILAFIAAATVVSAADTNRARFARGLGPISPAKRSKSGSAWQSKPSSKPPVSQCNTGSKHCCNTKGYSGQSNIDDLLSTLGLLGQVAPQTMVVADCTPIAGQTCSSNAVCCDNDKFNGLINLSCNSIVL